MPKVTVSVPFNFRAGGKVEHFKAGLADLSPAALAHAEKHGFLAKPKADKPGASAAPSG